MDIPALLHLTELEYIQLTLFQIRAGQFFSDYLTEWA